MRNNKLFIAMPSLDNIKLDDLRMSLENDEALFDRHGDAGVAYKTKHFGFATVVPKLTGKKPASLAVFSAARTSTFPADGRTTSTAAGLSCGQSCSVRR